MIKIQSGLLSGQNINGSAGFHHPAVPEVDIRVLRGDRLLHLDGLGFTRVVDLKTESVLFSQPDTESC